MLEAGWKRNFGWTFAIFSAVSAWFAGSRPQPKTILAVSSAEPAKVRVVDGDTFEAELELGWGVRMTAKVRVHGLNAPELDTPEGVRWKLAAERVVRGSKRVYVLDYGESRSFERVVGGVVVMRLDGTLAGWSEAVRAELGRE